MIFNRRQLIVGAAAGLFGSQALSAPVPDITMFGGASGGPPNNDAFEAARRALPPGSILGFPGGEGDVYHFSSMPPLFGLVLDVDEGVSFTGSVRLYPDRLLAVREFDIRFTDYGLDFVYRVPAHGEALQPLHTAEDYSRSYTSIAPTSLNLLTFGVLNRLNWSPEYGAARTEDGVSWQVAAGRGRSVALAPVSSGDLLSGSFAGLDNAPDLCAVVRTLHGASTFTASSKGGTGRYSRFDAGPAEQVPASWSGLGEHASYEAANSVWGLAVDGDEWIVSLNGVPVGKPMSAGAPIIEAGFGCSTDKPTAKAAFNYWTRSRA
jgi:hypothetical protein